CRVIGVSFSLKKNEAFYIPIGHRYVGSPKQLSWDQLKPFLKSVLEKEGILKCGQNLKFDDAILNQHGITPKGPSFDTMIASYCLVPDRSSHGLKALSADYLSERMTQFKELVGKQKNASIADVPIDKAADYAGADAEVVLRLVDIFTDMLKKEELNNLFEEQEMPLVPVLREMESNGILVDTQYLNEVEHKFRKEMARIEQEIYSMAGESFMLNSTKQLSRILFEKLNLPVIKRTKTGYSTNEDVLTKLSKKHPICEKILAYRELAKLTSTYVDSLLSLVDPISKRVHTTFHQTGTTTGRLSSSDPNLQNIPIRTELGREIRKAFVAPAGSVLVSADYSQIDLRALAHISEDPALIKAFQEGGDIHTATAAEVFHITDAEVTSDMRQKAKAINFGIVYG
ncbi:hypothetical protein BVX98_03140, partial [bacterium F11]